MYKNDLNLLRSEIDKIDCEMAKLFEKRMNTVLKVAKYKKENGVAITDTIREKEVIERGVSEIDNKDLSEFYIEFQNKVMELSRKYQIEKNGE